MVRKEGMENRDRCKTGIKVLDKELLGVFPQGATILIAGIAGVGKTTLCMEFCVNGARYNEKGVFFLQLLKM